MRKNGGGYKYSHLCEKIGCGHRYSHLCEKNRLPEEISSIEGLDWLSAGIKQIDKCS
jgi:hypothetical protein